MTQIQWDATGEKVYETGVDRGVLYIPNELGAYENGYGWNGLVSVTESPEGAEVNKQYADNQVYVALQSAEEFNGTIEAFMSPPEFDQCDGSIELSPGVTAGQQSRKAFGFSYRTKIGNDLNEDAGYKIHLVYGAKAAPSEKAYTTINDSPEAMTLSWEVSTTPIYAGPNLKNTATLVIDSTKVDPGTLADFEAILYGTVSTDPELPLPQDVAALFEGTLVEATPTTPAFDQETNTITIPVVTGVQYRINNVVRTGSVVIAENTVVKANTIPGYRFVEPHVDQWLYTYEP